MDRDTALTLLFLALLAVPLIVLLRRANELCVLDVIDGKVHLVRGRAPQRLLNHFADVLTRPVIKKARLRVVVDNGRPALRAEQIPPQQLQRLRNVLGMFTREQLRNAPSPKGR